MSCQYLCDTPMRAQPSRQNWLGVPHSPTRPGVRGLLWTLALPRTDNSDYLTILALLCWLPYHSSLLRPAPAHASQLELLPSLATPQRTLPPRRPISELARTSILVAYFDPRQARTFLFFTLVAVRSSAGSWILRSGSVRYAAFSGFRIVEVDEEDKLHASTQ